MTTATGALTAQAEASPTTDIGSAQRPAVIDIGSNSVRLVVYDRLARVSTPIFNERVLCGLGRNIAETGRLHADSIEPALENLQRFAAIARVLGAGVTRAVATAAVREASDGAQFVRAIEDRAGLVVRVLSGAEEAELSGLGVLSSIPDAEGIVGDFGGGSLELVELASGAPRRHATLPIGAVRLGEAANMKDAALAEEVDRLLTGVAWLEEQRGRPFYALGGTWRALARIAADQSGYPVPVVHHYRLDRSQAEDLARSVEHLDRKALKEFSALPSARRATLPYGALVLERAVAVLEPSELVFSAHGLREGLLYDMLPEHVRAEDPLLVCCTSWAEQIGRAPAYGEALFRWLEATLGPHDASPPRLRRAACLLSDIAWRDHPDHRAMYAFDQVLRGPLVGIDHPGRAYVALALAARYRAAPDAPFLQAATTMLSADAAAAAQRLGLALRLANSISAGEPALLRQTGLRLEAGRVLSLVVEPDASILVGDRVKRGLAALADALNLRSEVALVAPLNASA